MEHSIAQGSFKAAGVEETKSFQVLKLRLKEYIWEVRSITDICMINLGILQHGQLGYLEQSQDSTKNARNCG